MGRMFERTPRTERRSSPRSFSLSINPTRIWQDSTVSVCGDDRPLAQQNGIARPACSDPYLPASIISGKVSGVTEDKLPPGDFGLQVMAAGVQMEAIARGEPVFDLSDPKALSRFGEAAKVFQKRTAEDAGKGVISAGYFVLGAPEVVST